MIRELLDRHAEVAPRQDDAGRVVGETILQRGRDRRFGLRSRGAGQHEQEHDRNPTTLHGHLCAGHPVCVVKDFRAAAGIVQ